MTTMHANSAEPGKTRLRVLIPLDGSDLAAKALPIAASLCRTLSGELHIVTVLPPVISPFVAHDAYMPPEVFQQLIDNQELSARDFMTRAQADASALGLEGPVVTHIEHGETAITLLDVIEHIQPALAVMTTHGRTGLARFALGSIADKIVRGGIAPVLLLRSFATPMSKGQVQAPTVPDSGAVQSFRPAVPQLSHALAPLDGSAASEATLFSLAPKLAGPLLKSITLLRVADPRDGEQGRVEAETYLADARERLMKAPVGHDCVLTTRVEVNRKPADAILTCASTTDCDLIIMATRSEAGIRRLAFGSVADSVLQDGQTPLLLTRPPTAQR